MHYDIEGAISKVQGSYKEYEGYGASLEERGARVFFQRLEEVEKRRPPGTFASGEVLPRVLVPRLRPSAIAAAAGE